MLLKTFKSGKLDVRIYDSRKSMGQAAADDVAACIRDLLSRKDEIRIIFAAAPSQNEFLEALVSEPGIEWNRIHALHMDEYVGLPADAPQGFGNFLKAAIFGKVPFAGVDYIGSDADPDEACRRYTRILDSVTVDMVCMGIGENGHIAFNDPHVADFDDPLKIKKVDLDETCRLQQVHDGCFDDISQVCAYAHYSDNVQGFPPVLHSPCLDQGQCRKGCSLRACFPTVSGLYSENASECRTLHG